MKTPINLSVIHALVGLLTFVIFLQTGWFMKTNNIDTLSDAHRLIYRAGHIYFLFSGLLNLSIGIQLKISHTHWKMLTQYIGSGLLLLAPIILLYGFFQEASLGVIERELTKTGIFVSLAGTSFHAFVFFTDFIQNKIS